MHHQPDAQPQKAVNLAHPFAVALGQVIVNGYHVHAFAGQRVQVNRHRGNQRFAFAGLHLGNAGAVQHNTADDLHGVGLQAQHTPVGFAANRERFGQNIVQAGAIGQLLLERRGLGLQLGIGQLLHFRFERKHLVRNRADPFELLIREAAEQFFQERHRDTSNQRFLAPLRGVQIHKYTLIYNTPAQAFLSNLRGRF